MPSKAQSEAICHVNGPAILIAGPGSGKTFTIVKRLQYLIAKANISPDNILVVTFSKAAANEMEERFCQESDEYGVHFGTFHSIAYYILKTSFDFNNNSLMSEAEKRNILSIIIKNHGYGQLCNIEFLTNILDEISKNKNSASYQKFILSSKSEDLPTEELNKIIDDFNSFKCEMSKLDFDDMILICLKKLQENKDILYKYQDMFRYILVDEFQDINKPQYDLIKLLCGTKNIFVVGDDDQAIYGFRGSTPGVMFEFERDFNGTKKIMLTDNYRCKSNIVDFASKVISKNDERFNKEFNPINIGGNVYFKLLDSRLLEEKYILSIISNLSKDELSDTALIVRTNMEVALYKNMLKLNGIDVAGNNKNCNGHKEDVIAQDIISFLKFIYEGNRRSDYVRIMNKPNIYVSQSALIKEVVNPDDLYNYYSKNEDMLKVLREYFNKIKLAQSMSPNLAISIFRRTIGYDRYLKSISRNQLEYQSYLECAQGIENIFKSYNKNISIQTYYDEHSGAININPVKNTEGVKILTMHTSKGLEFKNVFLPDVNEGVIPGKRSDSNEIKEERRLLYVAITRAKDNLYILSTNERNRMVSRFIKGIVNKL